jgi:hypothetical protein
LARDQVTAKRRQNFVSHKKSPSDRSARGDGDAGEILGQLDLLKRGELEEMAGRFRFSRITAQESGKRPEHETQASATEKSVADKRWQIAKSRHAPP